MARWTLTARRDLSEREDEWWRQEERKLSSLSHLFLAPPSSFPFLWRRLQDCVHISLAGFFFWLLMCLHLELKRVTGYKDLIR
jgi:hypothetical protein